MIKKLVSRYMTDQVSSHAAALAYYLLFSLFPLLILLGQILGGLHLDVDTVQRLLMHVMPSSTVDMMTSYLRYITNSFNTSVMIFSLVFSIYFPYRVVARLMGDVRRAWGQKEEPVSLKYIGKVLLCTLLFPTTVFLSLLMIIFGHNVISFLLHLLLPGTVRISSVLLDTWQYLRFAAAAALMAFSLGVVYEFSLDEFVPVKTIRKGTMLAIIVWLAGSVLFSAYVENYADYSLIYGTLGAFVVLMMWLWMTALIFIMGAEYNALKAEREKL